MKSKKLYINTYPRGSLPLASYSSDFRTAVQVEKLRKTFDLPNFLWIKKKIVKPNLKIWNLKFIIELKNEDELKIRI